MVPTDGTLAIHIVGALTAANVRARVDGHPVELFVPVTYVTLPAGRHRVEVEGLQGFVTSFGETEADVEVPPGGQVDLHYALPRTILSQGRIGPEPQQRTAAPHWGNIAWGVGGAAVLFLLLCLGATGVALWQVLTGG